MSLSVLEILDAAPGPPWLADLVASVAILALGSCLMGALVTWVQRRMRRKRRRGWPTAEDFRRANRMRQSMLGAFPETVVHSDVRMDFRPIETLDPLEHPDKVFRWEDISPALLRWMARMGGETSKKAKAEIERREKAFAETGGQAKGSRWSPSMGEG